jgi:hypothetical protein
MLIYVAQLLNIVYRKWPNVSFVILVIPCGFIFEQDHTISSYFNTDRPHFIQIRITNFCSYGLNNEAHTLGLACHPKANSLIRNFFRTKTNIFLSFVAKYPSIHFSALDSI